MPSAQIDIEPGVYEGVPFETYLTWKAENQSRLKHMLSSPQTYLSESLKPSKPTRAMILGSALDNFVFEYEFFERHYRYHNGRRAGRIYDDLVDVYGEQYVLTQDEMSLCLLLKHKIENDALIKDLLLGSGISQLSIVWEDPKTGIRCKARIDRCVPDLKLLLDLKSSDNCNPKRWFYHSRKMNYPFQSAFYLMGCEAVGIDVQDFAHITFETKGAHILTPYQVPSEDIELGRQQVRECLDKLAMCHQTNEWHGYVNPGEFGVKSKPDSDTESEIFTALMEFI